MTDRSPPPDPEASEWSTIEDAYRGFVAFGVLNVIAFFAASPHVQTTIPAVVFLAAIGALAAWIYRSLGRHAFAAGLLGGYALMTIISGGACTLFLNQPLLTAFNVVSGSFLYAGAIAVFGLAVLVRRLSESE